MKRLLPLFAFYLSAFCLQAQTVPSYFPIQGLKAAYLFSGNAADSSGNGLDGTVFGPTLTTDRFGKANSAYYFNGTSDYITLPAASIFDITNSSLTLSAWIKCNDNNPTSGKVIVWRGNIISAHDPYQMAIYSGQMVFRKDVGSGTTTNLVSFPSTSIDTSKWHLVVGTFDSASSKYSIYYDGALMNQQVLPGTMSYSTSGFETMIGAHDDPSIYPYFFGKIDEVGIWKRPLTYCEIKRLYYSIPSLITSNPFNDSVLNGGIASFSIRDTDTATSYQWQVNVGSGFTNVPTSLPYVGATTKTLTINPVAKTMDGYIFRCLRGSTSCNDTSSTAKLVVKTTGLNTVTAKDISIYPNPVDASVNIHLPYNVSGTVQIINTLGQTVLQKHIASGNNAIDMRSYQHGLYTIKLELNGSIIFEKILKE
jgi:hypothetical protein